MSNCIRLCECEDIDIGFVCVLYESSVRLCLFTYIIYVLYDFLCEFVYECQKTHEYMDEADGILPQYLEIANALKCVYCILVYVNRNSFYSYTD